MGPAPRLRPRPAPLGAVVRLSHQRPTKERISLKRASFRSDPCLRNVAFHFVTACQGSPSRRASARAIDKSRSFQSINIAPLSDEG